MGRMRIRNAWALGFAWVPLLLSIPIPIRGQQIKKAESFQDEDVLSRQLPEITLHQVTIARAFWEIMNDAQVPGGIVSVQGHPEERKVNLTIPAGSTLRQALNQVVSESRSLQWHLDAGVVDLLPLPALPEILNVRMAAYDFEDANNGSLAVQRLLEEPEIQKRLLVLGWQPLLQTGLTVYYGPNEKPPAPIPVHLKNVTLVTAINNVMRLRGPGLWKYDEGLVRSQRTFTIVLGAGPPS